MGPLNQIELFSLISHTRNVSNNTINKCTTNIELIKIVIVAQTDEYKYWRISNFFVQICQTLKNSWERNLLLYFTIIVINCFIDLMSTQLCLKAAYDQTSWQEKRKRICTSNIV